MLIHWIAFILILIVQKLNKKIIFNLLTFLKVKHLMKEIIDFLIIKQHQNYDYTAINGTKLQNNIS